jgi:hypothetical protein
MDYIRKISTWREFLSEASRDPYGSMDENVRSVLTVVAPKFRRENRLTMLSAAWKTYKETIRKIGE